MIRVIRVIRAIEVIRAIRVICIEGTSTRPPRICVWVFLKI